MVVVDGHWERCTTWRPSLSGPFISHSVTLSSFLRTAHVGHQSCPTTYRHTHAARLEILQDCNTSSRHSCAYCVNHLVVLPVGSLALYVRHGNSLTTQDKPNGLSPNVGQLLIRQQLRYALHLQHISILQCRTSSPCTVVNSLNMKPIDYGYASCATSSQAMAVHYCASCRGDGMVACPWCSGGAHNGGSQGSTHHTACGYCVSSFGRIVCPACKGAGATS